jgi:hypothetical protein
MKMRTLSFLAALTALFLSACTDLEEEIRDGVVPGEGNVDVQSLLDDAYLSLQQFSTQDNIWALQQHSSDETMGPTRGTDWDDNGIWRVLHDHTWDSEHNFVRTSWNSMGRGLYLSNNILAFEPSTEVAAQARFLRAFYVYIINDHWGQVPMREPGEDIASTDPTVMGSAEAIDFAISEMEAVAGDLATGGVPAYEASLWAAHGFLAKMYLNKAVYTSGDRSNPSFSAEDMNKVIENCDAIINSGAYSLSADYYDNFRPANDMLSTELIFTSLNQGGIQAGNVRSRWYCTLHYNMNPSGWNGFCTIADFYDTFDDDGDVRKSATSADLTDVTGMNLGFLVGQQQNELGENLEDRKGNPLDFTKEVSIFETGDNLEVTGIRVMKYVPDFAGGDNSDNDLPLLRYADVLLMKAEAIARGGTATGGATAESLVDEIRVARGASARGDGSLDAIYRERGYELYWEGHRRQDMIRFGKFNEAWNEKPASESFRNLFPIPAIELAANPNLTQNPGY